MQFQGSLVELQGFLDLDLFRIVHFFLNVNFWLDIERSKG